MTAQVFAHAVISPPGVYPDELAIELTVDFDPQQTSTLNGSMAPARNEFAEFALGDIGNGEVIEVPSSPADHGISVARFHKRR